MIMKNNFCNLKCFSIWLKEIHFSSKKRSRNSSSAYKKGYVNKLIVLNTTARFQIFNLLNTN